MEMAKFPMFFASLSLSLEAMAKPIPPNMNPMKGMITAPIIPINPRIKPTKDLLALGMVLTIVFPVRVPQFWHIYALSSNSCPHFSHNIIKGSFLSSSTILYRTNNKKAIRAWMILQIKKPVCMQTGCPILSFE